MSSLILLFSLLVPGAGAVSAQPEELRMWMTVGERRFAVTLTDNAAARAFAAQLPLTLDMSELNGNEKHADLPKPLPANANRPGTIRNGDLMLYGADSLVVFYLTFQSSYSYTRLGRVDDPSDLPQALGPRGVRVLFSKDQFLNDAGSVSSSAATPGGEMEIKRSGSQPSAKGPAEWFTGTVRIDPLFDAPVPARAAGASVTFEPGARTAWHTHPLGQTLIVTSGVGRAQRWGGPIEEIRPGDVVWFSPGEKHWHGAAPTTAMTHIAIQEKLDGKPVDWLEHVTPEQYEGRSGGS